MAKRWQNTHSSGRVPSYYVRNRLYPGAYTHNDYPTRISRRMHENLALTANYGLDTISDDVNSSPYSSPYYINGRYNSDNLVTQRGNSASVQGMKYLLSLYDYTKDFTQQDFDDGEAIQTTIDLWQGKQIKFEIPYSGKVVGNTIAVKNTDGCTGILSIYFSAKEGGQPIYETAIDLCDVSEDKFEFFTLRASTPVSATANPRGKLYVRMEISGEISSERSENPFNTGRKIEIAATGIDGHYAAVTNLVDKNVPANSETYNYQRFPSRPLIGLVYNDYSCIPVDRIGDQKTGATVSANGYRYDIFCIRDESHAELIIYDREMNRIIDTPNIRVDGRAKEIQIAQVVDTSQNNWVYYVDGYSPLQRFKIGTWQSMIVTPEGTDDSDVAPVIGASLILFHNNRLYIGGFLNDKNLFQCSVIEEAGSNYTVFPYRFYAPNNSPYALTTNTPTALVEYTSDTIMILGENFYSLFTTNVALEDTSDDAGMPQQTSSFMDSVGVQSQGDIVNYKGVLYSFDPKEGIRRYTGGAWNRLPNDVDSHFDRVDMSKPRKMWGFANKLYFNYSDKIDGKYKCLIWDMQMNYQQFPWFQDVDIPFCDARYDEKEQLIGIHPDYPCIMELYAEDTWRRLDTPITFERHTKYLELPGNSQDVILKRIHNEVIANSNRWWWFGISPDKQLLTQYRGRDAWYRMPCWATLMDDEPVEAPFSDLDIYEKEAKVRLNINNLRIQANSVQIKIKTKTFRDQASLISTVLEMGANQFD